LCGCKGKYGKCVRNKYYNCIFLINIKDSGYCVAVSVCTVSVWEINIITDFFLIYIKESGYFVAVRECTLSVWEINIITGIYVNLE
jgi:hypothetical protein